MKTEHVRDHRRRHLAGKLDQCRVARRDALDADSSEPHAQIVGMLVTTGLTTWEQPLGLLELSGDSDLPSPRELTQELPEWLGHPHRLFAEADEELTIRVADVMNGELRDVRQPLRIDDHQRADDSVGRIKTLVMEQASSHAPSPV